MICKVSPFEKRTSVCLIAYNAPLVGDRDPRRLPLLAVKTSVGKAIEKGPFHYLVSEWKDGWSEWLSQSVEAFPSVLEHVTFTFFIDGCSRVCSHQLVRHRLVSFTQESQRYTEARILKGVEARDLREAFDKWSRVLGTGDRSSIEKVCVLPFEDSWRTCASAVLEYVTCRLNGGKMEDCRYVLPQGIRTSILMTANLREYLHIIDLRTDPRAQWEIRGIATVVKDLINRIIRIPDKENKGRVSRRS